SCRRASSHFCLASPPHNGQLRLRHEQNNRYSAPQHSHVSVTVPIASVLQHAMSCIALRSTAVVNRVSRYRFASPRTMSPTSTTNRGYLGARSFSEDHHLPCHRLSGNYYSR